MASRAARTATSSWSTSKGLVRYPTAPAARSRFAWTGEASAETMIDGNLRRQWVGQQGRQHLLARHVGQVQVEQDQVRALLPRQRETARALTGDAQTDVAGQREDLLDQTHVRRVVLDVEHGDRGAKHAMLVRPRCAPVVGVRPSRSIAASSARLRVSSNQTVVPTPFSLDSPSVPPIASTSPRATASPRPVPSIPRLGASSRSNGVNSTADRLLRDADPTVDDFEADTPAGVWATAMTTLPPRRLYLTAFETRLSSTCISRLRSART